MMIGVDAPLHYLSSEVDGPQHGIDGMSWVGAASPQ